MNGVGARGGVVPHPYGVSSEAGRLRTVLLHRPGSELARAVGHGADELARARREHDALAGTLGEQAVDVLYVTELLRDVLAHQPARHQVVAPVLGDARLGDELGGQVHRHLDGLDADALARVLVAGLTRAEFRAGRGAVYALLDDDDFLIDPLPDLRFTRSSSAWLRDGVAVASPTAAARRREARLLRAIYEHHPRFAGTLSLYRPDLEPLDAADLVLLAPGVLAVGVGGCTRPAAVERLSRRLFDAGLVRTVLAVASVRGNGCAQGRRQSWAPLAAVCAPVDVDTVVMAPALAYALTARSVTRGREGSDVSAPEPFLAAAAVAMGLDQLRVVDAGGGAAHRRDVGGGALTIGPGRVLCCAADTATSAALEAAGIEVVRMSGGDEREAGGPRRLSCPVSRASLSGPGTATALPDGR